VIVSPAPDQAFPVGAAIEVWGWTWADRGVDIFDVSVDGGSSWMRAAVEPATSRSWQRFAATWRPAHRGGHELCSRAQSADGRCQPLSGARNAIHRVPIEIA